MMKGEREREGENIHTYTCTCTSLVHVLPLTSLELAYYVTDTGSVHFLSYIYTIHMYM